MNYVNHINKFASSQDVQSALDNEELVKPYVALVGGALDYNTLSPEEPGTYLGVWSGHTFQVTNTDTSAWGAPVKIAQLNGVYSDGNLCDMDVNLNYDDANDYWHMEFFNAGASSNPSKDFTDTTIWESGVMTDPNESNSTVNVTWDGAYGFAFDVADGNITTINPEG